LTACNSHGQLFASVLALDHWCDVALQLPLQLHRTRLSHVQIIHTHTRIYLRDIRAVFACAVLLRFAEEATFNRQCPSFGRLQLFRRFTIFALKSPEIMNHSTSFLDWHVLSVSLDIAS
jgi:hypothetical protein